MGLSRINSHLLLLVFISLLASLSASTFISDGIFRSSVSSERRLLQAKKQCPISLEFRNYTIITDRCKGPDYRPELCCPAFKEFACPFAEELNDLSNDCATIMFSYINLNGRYPPGLFSNECREGQNGLECPASTSGSSQNSNSSVGQKKMCNLLAVMMIVVVSFLLLQFM
ncbi:GPI-anchored protein lorelei [Phtheirospermum japonicum]|uniref:GPI-anchored protein lorelei n=1 Tax=Phtheirospermum japonicum TaxID=374723 RepID=A0A830CFT8_9LAMI|nr:GPI-anchored protein lorelei [Phtheirospermum japonicum]